jgi:predicted PurR-regulated permease PerM
MLGFDARAARYTWTAAMVLLLLCLVYMMRGTLFVFIVALLFAYLLSPLVNVIDRLLPGRRTRTPALTIAYVIFIGLLFLAATQIGSRVADEANSLAKSTPALLARMQQPAPAVSATVNSVKDQILRKIQEQINKNSSDIISNLPKAGAKILSVVGNLIFVVIIPILGFFFLKDGATMRQYFLQLIEDGPWRAEIDEFLADVNLLLAHYMRAILLLSLAAFTAYSIFFHILGIPYSFLLAVIGAALEFIPMIGPLAAAVLVVIVSAAAGGPVVGLIVFLGVYRVFQDYVLSPQLMGAGVELHPLLVLFGVFAGAEIAGVPGAFLSVPTLALVRIVYKRIRTLRATAARRRLAPAQTA